MSEAPPLWFFYAGEGQFDPAGPHTKSVADKHYTIGERYSLITHYGRSEASHGHQFAAIEDAWANLPPDLRMLHPSPVHLRKWALVKSGWCNTQIFPMASEAAAKELQEHLESHDEFAIVIRRGDVVTLYTAKSQSRKAMPGDEFQRSKSDCLAVIAPLLGTTPQTLESNPGKSGEGTR